MRRAVRLFVALMVAGYETLHAQCPDGSRPPCRAAHAPRAPLDTNAIAIFPFRVSGPPGAVGWLKQGAMDLLGIALDEVGGWRVVDPRTIRAESRGFTDRSSPAAAASIAAAVGAGRLALGRAVGTETDLRLSVALLDTRSGATLATVSARGSAADPGPAMDSVAIALFRERLTRGAPGPRPVDQYATASPGALSAYVSALDLTRQGYWQDAADSLKQAVARDSTFTSAWYQLIRIQKWSPAEIGTDFHTLLSAALRDSLRASRRLRLMLQFFQARDQGLWLDHFRLAEALVSAYPQDPDALVLSADLAYHEGGMLGLSPRSVRALFERAIAIDPGVPEAYLHLVPLDIRLADTSGAWRDLARLQSVRNATWSRSAEFLTRLALLKQPSDRLLAERTCADGSVETSVLMLDDPLTPARALRLADSLAAVLTRTECPAALRIAGLLRRQRYALAAGRYQEAWGWWRQAAALNPDGDDLLGGAILQRWVTGEWRTEARLAADALALRDTAPLLAPALLRLLERESEGLLDSAAAALLDRGAWKQNHLRSYHDAVLTGLSGLAKLRAGDSLAARRDLAAAYPVHDPIGDGFAPDPRFALELARLAHAARDEEGALRYLQAATGLPEDVVYWADGEELRGAIHEQMADTAAAIRGYRNFIDLWQNADPELQPRVAAARAALAKLER